MSPLAFSFLRCKTVKRTNNEGLYCNSKKWDTFESYNLPLREWNFSSEIGGGGGGVLLLPASFFISLFTSFRLYFLFLRSVLFTFFSACFLLRTWVNRLLDGINKLHWHSIFYMICIKWENKARSSNSVFWVFFRCSSVPECSAVPLFRSVPVFLVLVHAEWQTRNQATFRNNNY